MKNFIFKSISITLIALLIFLFKNLSILKNLDVKSIPKNNLSNSICFKAKMDHAVNSFHFKNCTFLVAGSSMALNNVSGTLIAYKTKENVYNISSWGCKINSLNQLLNIIDKKNIKYLLITFNNTDFGPVVAKYKIDMNATDLYLNSNTIIKKWIFLNKLNIATFLDDWEHRSIESHTNNHYRSLNFDSTGSVLFEHKGFVIDKRRWNHYFDTTGFSYFYKSIDTTSSICEENNIKLILTYLPTRSDLLTANYEIQNSEVAQKLKKKFKTSFIDLHNVKIPSDEYCDGIHLYKKGAERITTLILDSIIIQKGILLPD